jgi:hydroxymethylpyrimidine/phosphomethylpyrimidine kinase
MSPIKRIPCALTIAGSDSGGGAGIQADLKVFAACGVHGTSAITCITAQNPKAVTGIQACSPAIVRGQIEAVQSELRPSAAKTGMLFSREIIRVVMDWRKTRGRGIAFVVDPVMVATSGARLLKPAAIRSMLDLLHTADLVMPNLQEAEILADMKLKDAEDLRKAARRIHERYGCAALVKGGHLRQLQEAVDIFYDGKEELLLTAPFIRGVSTHGTGCTYSAAVTAALALGLPMDAAVIQAKEFITQAIQQTQRTARHTILNCFWKR